MLNQLFDFWFSFSSVKISIVHAYINATLLINSSAILSYIELFNNSIFFSDAVVIVFISKAFSHTFYFR